MPFVLESPDDDTRGDADLVGEFDDRCPCSDVGILDEGLEASRWNQRVCSETIRFTLRILLITVLPFDEH